MKIAYFDCFSGVSGNMILSAFLDSGLDFEYFKKQIGFLKLSGYRLQKKRVNCSGFSAIKLEIILDKSRTAAHKRKSLREIKNIIEKCRFNPGIKKSACKIFESLACAESTAHGLKKNQVHFHEIGDTDSLIDVVGAAVAFDYFKFGRIFSSAVNVGSGMVKTAHGFLPVPAPAASLLLKGVPVYSGGEGRELATPTGVAILKSMANGFGDMPLMDLKAVGCGAGSYNLSQHPDLLRLFQGEAKSADYLTDTVSVLEANIDDMNLIGSEMILERIFKAGALDVYFTPVYMKKTRMGVLLTVVAEKRFLNNVLKAIFEETTTFGVRTFETQRYKLQRSFATVRTKYGPIKIKIGKLGDETINVSPEYESCKELSLKRGIPLRKAYEAAKSTNSIKKS